MKVGWFLMLLMCKQYFAFRYSEKQCPGDGSPCRLLANNRELDIALMMSKEEPTGDADKSQYASSEDHYSYKIKRRPSSSQNDRNSLQFDESRPRGNSFIRFGRNDGGAKNGFIRLGRNSPADDSESIRFGRRGDQFIRLGKRQNDGKTSLARSTRTWEASPLDNLTLSKSLVDKANRYIRFGRRDNGFLNSGESALKEESI